MQLFLQLSKLRGTTSYFDENVGRVGVKFDTVSCKLLIINSIYKKTCFIWFQVQLLQDKSLKLYVKDRFGRKYVVIIAMYIDLSNYLSSALFLFNVRELSQIMFAFLAFFDHIRTLVCTFTVVNLAFFWPPTHP